MIHPDPPGPARHGHGGWRHLAGPHWGINHVLSYGQSLSHGWEGNPALSTTARLDTLMLGDSVRPLSENAPAWQPVAGPRFQPLRATVQQHWGGDVLPAEVAARETSVLLGETVLESALNHLRARMAADGTLDPGCRLLGSAAGVGGRPIEALCRGAEPDLFNRLRDCARAARALSQAQGLSYGVLAFLFLQGEHNAFALSGTSDRAAYARLQRRLHADMIEHVARAIAGQSAAPALFTYQTGGQHATATNGIAQAQLETALSLPGCFMVGPCYHLPTKIDHLDANGYRWLGAQFGKVMHRVLCLGEDWQPLHALSALHAGRAIDIAFHVPVPPLRWGLPFVGQAQADVPDRGFALFDRDGEIPLAAVTLDGPDTVRLLPARIPRGGVRVRYAAASRGGRGCLHDSDPTLSDDSYAYAADQGHWPSANLPALVGCPYELANWCAAFTLDVV